MNTLVFLNRSAFRLLYYQYKEYVTPLLIVFLSVVLLIVFVVPQTSSFFAMKNEENVYRKKVSVLKSNVMLLSGVNDTTLDTQFATVSKALPAEKDFAGILNALSSSASIANVGLGDFTLAVGDLSTKSAEPSKRPSLEITLNLTADVEGTKRFLKELSEKLPLSEVVSVHLAARSATVKTIFYYKPFSAKRFDSSTSIKGLSSAEKNFLEQISSWTTR